MSSFFKFSLPTLAVSKNAEPSKWVWRITVDAWEQE